MSFMEAASCVYAVHEPETTGIASISVDAKNAGLEIDGPNEEISQNTFSIQVDSSWVGFKYVGCQNAL